jgi:hypothetical protein
MRLLHSFIACSSSPKESQQQPPSIQWAGRPGVLIQVQTLTLSVLIHAVLMDRGWLHGEGANLS